MPSDGTDVVTGAFSFTGRYVAERLLDDGREVVTLTNHPDRTTPFSDRVRAEPYRFDDPDALAATLEGADTLYNTFWIRDPEAGEPPGDAVRYSRRLVRAAEDAGVRRIVHFSVAGAAESSLPYYQAKATAEEAVRDADLSHAILRPTLVYGREDMLVNNLAWLLRRFPVFAVYGDGEYRVQPVFVGDVADVAVERGARTEDCTLDVAGPDTYTFEGMIRRLADAIGARCRIVHAPPRVAHAGVKLLELLVRDEILSWGEARGLMDELLVADGPPRGDTDFADWAADNAARLGTEYTSYRERYGID